MGDAVDNPLTILCRLPDGTVEELPASRIDDIDRLTDREGTLVWAIARSPDDAQIADLGREFRLPGSRPWNISVMRCTCRRAEVCSGDGSPGPRTAIS